MAQEEVVEAPAVAVVVTVEVAVFGVEARAGGPWAVAGCSAMAAGVTAGTVGVMAEVKDLAPRGRVVEAEAETVVEMVSGETEVAMARGLGEVEVEN